MKKFQQTFSLPTRATGSSTQPLDQGSALQSQLPSNMNATDTLNAIATNNGSQIAEPPWGLKLLYDGNDPLVDIVAVHGLNGERERTWTFESTNKSTNKGTNKDVLWLRDLLPARTPRARIWTWGYDSRTHSKSHQDHLIKKSLYEHGRELVIDLDNERRASNSYQRPIIFVTHSLGGIVVKCALLHSDRMREGHLEKERSIKLSTYGIIFMGTPHQGGQGVSVGKVMLNIAKIQGHTSDDLLKHLEEHSEFLQQQLSEFTAISQDFDVSFAYETKPTPIIGGTAIFIVPDWSAVVPGTPNAAHFGISDDHRRMTKFANAESKDFEKIARTIAAMIDKAEAKIESNWECEARKKEVTLGANSYIVPFEIRGVPIVNAYVERDQEMRVMEEELCPGADCKNRKVFVLHGLGGIGKTQLSLAYARKHQMDYTAVFWLNGQTHESIRRSIAGIARQLPTNQISAFAREYTQQGSDQLDKIIEEVLGWFSKNGNTKWLLIVDNVDRDNSAESEDPEAFNIDDYIPRTDQGSVIITTRQFRLRSLGYELKVGAMTTAEGLTVLENRLGHTAIGASNASTLVDRLGGLPLALAQAASYMRETNTSITEYVQSYNTVWDELMKDEAHPDLALREYGHGSVYTTWNISFESVKRKNEDAANFLQLWSYLGNGDIWYELFNNKQNPDLHEWSAPPEWFKRVVGGKTGFRKAVRVLLAYSLVEAKEDSDAFAMHPVVHEWCRNTMNADQRQEMAFLAITTVGFAVPLQMDFGDWRLQLRLLPHASQWLQRLKSAEDKTLCEGDWFALDRAISNLGILHYHQTKFAEAESLFQRVLDSRDRNPQPELGESDLITEACHNLGLIYLSLSKLDAAEAMLKRAQKRREVLSGPDDLVLIDITRGLGIVYRHQEKLAEAESTMQRALSASMRTVGPEHMVTLDLSYHFALVYRDQGNLIKAENMLKRALAGYESALGPDNLRTLDAVSALGTIYRQQGKIAEAEASNQQVLSGFKKILGPYHLWTIDEIFKLGILHECGNRLEDAEAAFRRVLAGYQNALGPENKRTLDAYCYLGYVLYRQGKLVEAGPIFEQLLSGNKKTFGADHQWTKYAANDLSKVYKEQGRLAEAEAILQSVS